MPGFHRVATLTSTATIAALLRQHYGVQASLTPLPGDVDDNFLAEMEDGTRLVVKLVHAGCAQDVLDMQCAALQHLEGNPLNLPRLIPSPAGRLWSTG